MRSKAQQAVWEPVDDESEWGPLEDIDWPDSSLDIDDDDFARAIAEGRGEELDAA